jgi:hypothetical protein
LLLFPFKIPVQGNKKFDSGHLWLYPQIPGVFKRNRMKYTVFMRNVKRDNFAWEYEKTIKKKLNVLKEIARPMEFCYIEEVKSWQHLYSTEMKVRNLSKDKSSFWLWNFSSQLYCSIEPFLNNDLDI